MPALHEVAVHRGEQLPGGVVLDALGDHLQTEVAAEVDDRLDRVFVAAMTGSPRAASIVTSTLQLAHALGLVLVAEGAEDQATVDALTSLGCDVVQGYHLSRPLPPEQLRAWLRERQGADQRV